MKDINQVPAETYLVTIKDRGAKFFFGGGTKIPKFRCHDCRLKKKSSIEMYI